MKNENRTTPQRTPKHSWKLRSLKGEASEALRTCPSLRAAAAKLGVHPSTLSRAVKSGRLTASSPPRQPAETGQPAPPDAAMFEAFQTFEADTLATYDLTRGERELLELAQQTRDVARDPAQPWTVRLAATKEFRALLGVLNLPVKRGEGQHGDVQSFPRRA